MSQNTIRTGGSILPRFFLLEMLMFTVAILSGFLVLWSLFTSQAIWILVTAGAFFTVSMVVVILLLLDPDVVRAGQTDAMLKLAGQTLACMQEGLNMRSAQKVCRLLLPSSSAIAVAITSKDLVLGYAGVDHEKSPPGSPIRTQATHRTVEDGKVRILSSFDDIGFPEVGRMGINAAIIVPLAFGGRVEGTLKFYYRNGSQITETQKSIAEGFGKLLSTQIAASALERERKLATRMELKMLQSQINPHFLFNTINTIASFVRTDPVKARELLRDFASFYRSTLEDSADLITMGREIEQTQRYFSFETARFGEERLAIEVEIDEETRELLVPPFLIQPLVENSIRHAMPSEGRLTVRVAGECVGNDLRVAVIDDGTGMSEEDRLGILHSSPPKRGGGMGIAVKNIHDRLKGYYGSSSRLDVESEPGRGTTVTLLLSGGATRKQR